MEVVNFDEQNGQKMVVEGAQEETDFEEAENPANLEIGLALGGIDSKESNLEEGKEIELKLLKEEVADSKQAENLAPEEGIEKTMFHGPWFPRKFFVLGLCGPLADLAFDLYNAYALYNTDPTYGFFAIGTIFVPSFIACLLILINYRALDLMKKHLPLISGKVNKI